MKSLSKSTWIYSLIQLSLFFFHGLLIISSEEEEKRADEGFVNDTKLECTVVDDSEKANETPNYCWTFCGDSDDGQPNSDDWDGNGCCWAAGNDDELPASLKGIVHIAEDGNIHIHYGQFTRTELYFRKNLLIPLKSKLKNSIDFTVQPIPLEMASDKTCDTYWTWPLNNAYRIAANSFHFSYTRTVDDDRRLSSNTTMHAYARQCAICDEFLYFSHGSSESKHFEIATNYSDSDGKFAWTDHSGYFDYDHFAPWYRPAAIVGVEENAHLPEYYKQVQRLDNLCPVNLQQWNDSKNGTSCGFYLPFRLLWPYAQLSDGRSLVFNSTSGCDYEIVFRGEDYQLLTSTKPTNNTKQSG